MSARAVINIPAADGVAMRATCRPIGAAATSEWFKREGCYAAQAVASADRAHRRSIERRLDRPSRRWTRSEVIRSYASILEGDLRFRDEAEVFSPRGYRPWIETHSPGNRRGGMVLLAASGAALFDEPDRRRRGKQSVSWVKDASLSEAASAP
jgi:hypothetical protein